MLYLYYPILYYTRVITVQGRAGKSFHAWLLGSLANIGGLGTSEA